MPNKWLKFLKQFKARPANKSMSLRDAMKAASKEYKKGGAAAEKAPAKKKRARRKKKT